MSRPSRIAHELPTTSLFLILLILGKLMIYCGAIAIEHIQTNPSAAIENETTNWILGIILIFGFGPPAIFLYYIVTIASHFALYIFSATLLIDSIYRRHSTIFYLFPPIFSIGAYAWSPVLRTWNIL